VLKFGASIAGGDGLKPSGRLVKAGIVTDGPYVEAKEVIASFAIIQADDYDAAVAIPRECLTRRQPEQAHTLTCPQ